MVEGGRRAERTRWQIGMPRENDRLLSILYRVSGFAWSIYQGGAPSPYFVTELEVAAR